MSLFARPTVNVYRTASILSCISVGGGGTRGPPFSSSNKGCTSFTYTLWIPSSVWSLSTLSVTEGTGGTFETELLGPSFRGPDGHPVSRSGKVGVLEGGALRVDFSSARTEVGGTFWRRRPSDQLHCRVSTLGEFLSRQGKTQIVECELFEK